MFTIPVASLPIVMNTVSFSPTVMFETCMLIFGEIPLTVTLTVVSIDKWFLSGVVMIFIVYSSSINPETVILLPSTLITASVCPMIVTFSSSIVHPMQSAIVDPSSSYAKRISGGMNVTAE